MASSEVERLQFEIIRELCGLPRDLLADLCDFLFIAGGTLEHVTGKSHAALITLISNHIQREELEDNGMTDLLLLKDNITEIQEVATLRQQKTQEAELQEEQMKKEEKQERIRKEIEALQLQLAETQNEEDKPVNREIKTPAPSRILTEPTPQLSPYPMAQGFENIWPNWRAWAERPA
ncbi:hypothetical protein NHX12_006924 [Muraenolepis orangiensis]|uniref:Uncharacterized protein n=1 Tax=Muraenolepis orangiensis TaxID=630683 RepID=A0A9Q0I977_9TELE|nr:hypothetical protein NHX12_006924 [Muraenolepis orangiensis]